MMRQIFIAFLAFVWLAIDYPTGLLLFVLCAGLC